MEEFARLYEMVISPALQDTFYMVLYTMLISVFIAFFLGIVLVVTDEKGLKPNKVVYGALDIIINILRSFPFIILAVSIIPLTRLLVGTSVGDTASIVPLTLASAPYIARLFENSFKEVNPSLIEAAKSFGASTSQIVFRVIVKESIPALVMNITLASITVLGLTAMAGAIGAGGLGAVGLTYGYQSFNQTIMYSTVALLILITIILQLIGSFLYKKLK